MKILNYLLFSLATAALHTGTTADSPAPQAKGNTLCFSDYPEGYPFGADGDASNPDGYDGFPGDTPDDFDGDGDGMPDYTGQPSGGKGGTAMEPETAVTEELGRSPTAGRKTAWRVLVEMVGAAAGSEVREATGESAQKVMRATHPRRMGRSCPRKAARAGTVESAGVEAAVAMVARGETGEVRAARAVWGAKAGREAMRSQETTLAAPGALAELAGLRNPER